MFSCTINCPLNEMYETPFGLSPGVHLMELTSSDAATTSVVSVGKDGAFAQQVLLSTTSRDGESILLAHVPRPRELAGVRIVRHNPAAPTGGECRDIMVTCASLSSLVAEISELRTEVERLKSSLP